MSDEKRPQAGDNPDKTQNGRDDATAVIDDLEALRNKAQERDQFLDLLKRTQADFDNFQKRNQRERDTERRYANTKFALDLMPVLDNFERASAAAQQAGETGTLFQGVQLVLSQWLDVFRRHGITPIEAQGQPFDPNLHQAVMRQPSAELPANSVAMVLEKGFMIHDRVLRPARVIVTAPPEAPAS